MRHSFVSSLLCLLWSLLVVAAPSGSRSASKGDLHVSEADSTTHSGAQEEYVVLIDKDDEMPDHVEHVLSRVSLSSAHAQVRHTYNNSAFRGFAASMHSHVAHTLSAMTDVHMVEKSVPMSLHADRFGAPWGLERISSDDAMSGDEHTIDFTYSFDDQSLGSGADIYVVDTGIRTDHRVFQGRARMGFSFDPNDFSDGEGHGTHVSGTAAGNWVGVALAANLIGVKVLGSDGSGTSSDTIKGIDYVLQQHDRRKGDADFVGSIVSMSLGLPTPYAPLDHAVQLATTEGVHVVVAAGNSGDDACSFTPSRSGGANSNVIAVGSVDIHNEVSSFSNTGPCTDIYAPGEEVLSAWSSSPTTLKFLDGTSMATPHVTGILAYLMVKDRALGSDPAAMKERLKSLASTDALTGATRLGDARLLVNNGFSGENARRSLESGRRPGKPNFTQDGDRLTLLDDTNDVPEAITFDLQHSDGEGPK